MLITRGKLRARDQPSAEVRQRFVHSKPDSLIGTSVPFDLAWCFARVAMRLARRKDTLVVTTRTLHTAFLHTNRVAFEDRKDTRLRAC